MRAVFRLWGVLLGLAAVALGERPVAAESRYSPLLLLSLDAFRWDYCDLYPAETPTLRRLRNEGASARALVPVFPSNTFPNHYSIVTGLRPARHGMINNRMYDPETGRFFNIAMAAAVRDPAWWGGEPIWVTAAKHGRRSACSFWVGSEAEIQGHRPTFWKPYDESAPFDARLQEMVTWMTLPAGERPEVVAFYLEEANSIGHAKGPRSPELAQALRGLDEHVSVMLTRLAEKGITPNLVIVSDHGMTEVRPDKVVILDEHLDLADVQVDFFGPVAGLRPLRGTVEDVLERLKALPGGARAMRAEDLPEHLHLKNHPRIPPVMILPRLGGWVGTRTNVERTLASTRGEHGYDPTIPEMQGVLIVQGPAFRADGAVIEPVENIHLYELFCAVLGLPPAPNDGDKRLVRAFLRTPE